jgi:hypothetical protein
MRRMTVPFLFVAAALLGAVALAQEAPPPAPAPETQAAPTPAPAPATTPAALFESLKIIVDGKVKSDGMVSFVFTPAGGQAKEIRVTLQKGMDRGDACRDMNKELEVALGGMPYDVNRFDPNKIKISGKKDAKFSLALGAQTVTGLTVQLK